MQPRSIGFVELIELLEKEHVEFNEMMSRIRRMIVEHKRSDALTNLTQMKEELYQHIVDEESSVLTLLIERFGREGAAEATEIFQEHVDIQSMIEELEDLLTTERLSTDEVVKNLDAFMRAHFRKEDERVFPKALKAGTSITVFA